MELKRRNPYASIAKKSWNNSCKIATELNDMCKLFKTLMNELKLRQIPVKKVYTNCFIGIVNQTWGDYLGMKAENFSDCKTILYEAKRLKFMISDACSELKEQYKLANARYSW